MPYFFQKLGKIFQNLSSAAVVIGALRVKLAEYILKFLISGQFWWIEIFSQMFYIRKIPALSCQYILIMVMSSPD